VAKWAILVEYLERIKMSITEIPMLNTLSGRKMPFLSKGNMKGLPSQTLPLLT
jgi:hypothetical protein